MNRFEKEIDRIHEETVKKADKRYEEAVKKAEEATEKCQSEIDEIIIKIQLGALLVFGGCVILLAVIECLSS